MERRSQDWDAGPGIVDSLLRHKWLVALAVLLGAVAAFGWSARQPVRYEATVQLFLGSAIGQDVAQSGDVDPDRVLRNQVELLGSAAVLETAVALSDRPLTRAQLQDRLSVEAAGDADVITIRVLDDTPGGAARLAELVPLAYQRLVTDRAKQAVADLQRTQDQLESDLARIQAALKAKPGDASLVADRESVNQELQRAADSKRQAEGIGAAQAARARSFQTRAVVGDEPAQPQPRRAGAVGALLGLAVSVALVSWRTGQQLRRDDTEQLAEPPEGVGRDLAVVEDVDGDVEPEAGEVRLLESVSRQLHRAEPPRRTRRQPRAGRVAPTKATEVRGPAGGINDFNQLTASIQRIFRSLEGHRYRLYEQNVPQMAADDIANWFPVDLVVILLENDQGLLQVAGGVGLTSFEEHMTMENNRDLLLQVVEMGSKLVDEEERARLASANVPGSQAETLVVVPLIYDQVAFGMLLMGQRRAGGTEPALGEDDVDRIRAWARDISPYLRAWLLLRYLKLRLRMVQ